MKITPKENYNAFLGGEYVDFVKDEPIEVSDPVAKAAIEIKLCDAPKKTAKKKNASS